jgi:hypothetical protein
LTDVTAPSSDLFVDPTEPDPSADQRPLTDVSQAAMIRLRTPFEVGTADRNTDHRAQQGE